MRKWLFFRVIIWGIVILVLCLLPSKDLSRIDIPKIPHLDKVAHFVLFFFLAAFYYSWLQPTYTKKMWNIISTLLVVAVYGGIIEWLQHAYFSRTGDMIDWLADLLGGMLGILLYKTIHRNKQKIFLFMKIKIKEANL